ncbi:MAG: hypothetical protein Q7T74_04505 [Candidatus Saccharibacteria bacterium]|nr:hypothetical protein [Candidatus Saccharibacteria bacterium]
MDSDLAQLDSPFANFTRRTFIGVVLTAIVASIVTLLLTFAIDKVVLQPAICNANEVGNCTQSAQISFHIASVIAAILAVVMLLQASVYRPLLVALAVTISLWSIYGVFLAKAAWPLQLLILTILSILAYVAFTWLLRTYSLIIALVSTIVLVAISLLVTNL